MVNELALKQTLDRAGKARFYAFNPLLNRWQRISTDRYQDWRLAYFGPQGQTVRDLPGCGRSWPCLTIITRKERRYAHT